MISNLLILQDHLKHSSLNSKSLHNLYSPTKYQKFITFLSKTKQRPKLIFYQPKTKMWFLTKKEYQLPNFKDKSWKTTGLLASNTYLSMKPSAEFQTMPITQSFQKLSWRKILAIQKVKHIRLKDPRKILSLTSWPSKFNLQSLWTLNIHSLPHSLLPDHIIFPAQQQDKQAIIKNHQSKLAALSAILFLQENMNSVVRAKAKLVDQDLNINLSNLILTLSLSRKIFQKEAAMKAISYMIWDLDMACFISKMEGTTMVNGKKTKWTVLVNFTTKTAP